MTDKQTREKRTKSLLIRLTPDERERLFREADALAMTVADFVRSRALGGPVRRRTRRRETVVFAADPELIRHVARMGGNLNQIARHLNTAAKTGSITRPELVEAMAAVLSAERHLAELLEVPP